MIAKTISDYGILEQLGSGGMGAVSKAEDTNLRRIVALKFLHASNDLPRLLREAPVAAFLNHANVRTVDEVDPESGFHEGASNRLNSVSAASSGRGDHRNP